jgi:hypothetical protein
MMAAAPTTIETNAEETRSTVIRIVRTITAADKPKPMVIKIVVMTTENTTANGTKHTETINLKTTKSIDTRSHASTAKQPQRAIARVSLFS